MAKAATAGEAKPLGIYVHIPFCRSKCEYCDFYSLGGGRNSELMRDYLSGLLQHIGEAAADARAQHEAEERKQHEAERAAQREQLLRIQEELRKVREQREAQKSEPAASEPAASEPESE